MESRTYLALLRRKGFSAFLAAQFLGAFNDNLFKWTLTFLMLAGWVSGAAGTDAANLNRLAIVFIAPTLFFAGPAGWLADGFEKRRVLVAVKALEIPVMLLAWLALRSADFRLQLGVLFLLATQFALFSPAKYGVVPELVDDADLSRANGLLEMSTYLAIMLGSVLAAPLFQLYGRSPDKLALVLLGVAMLGFVCILAMDSSRRPGPRTPWRWRLFWSEIGQGTRVMRRDRRLWAANLGAAYFWFQGALLQLLVVLLAKQVLGLGAEGITLMGVALAVGVGCGSLLAGRWSGGRVEWGLVPLGCLSMGVFCVLTALAAGAGHAHSVAWTLGLLALVGMGGGLFVVPLNATLQQRAGADEKGQVLAASNIFSTLAMIAAALGLDFGSSYLNLSADTLLLLSGLGCFVAVAGLCVLLPGLFTDSRRWLEAKTARRKQSGT